jgi:hypothetical protein
MMAFGERWDHPKSNWTGSRFCVFMVFDAAGILGCAMMCLRRSSYTCLVSGTIKPRPAVSAGHRTYSCKLESRFHPWIPAATGVCLLIQASKKLFRLLHAAVGGFLIGRNRTGSDFRKPSIEDFEGLGYRTDRGTRRVRESQQGCVNV